MMIIIPTAMEYNYYNVLYTRISYIRTRIVKKQMRPCGVKVFDNKNSLELASFDKDVMLTSRACVPLYIYFYYTGCIIFVLQADPWFHKGVRRFNVYVMGNNIQ